VLQLYSLAAQLVVSELKRDDVSESVRGLVVAPIKIVTHVSIDWSAVSRTSLSSMLLRVHASAKLICAAATFFVLLVAERGLTRRR